MHTTVVIVGAGQAGLAMSQRLSHHGVEHVLLERGTVANSWRTERWDSLRLLTPNWMTRLPGPTTAVGEDPDGFMRAGQVVTMLDDYRRAIDAPVVTGVTVTAVRRAGTGYVVESPQGRWEAAAVVVATGAASIPRIPALASAVPNQVDQLSPIHYRAPERLDGGPVLVVGASASGAQLAEELALSGREVVLAVGDHVRLPRTHRGMDIHWWLDAVGILDDRIGDRSDPDRARRLPSLQLVGSPGRRNLDLARLQDLGVVLAGRLASITSGRATFDESLPATTSAADARMGRLLDRIDAHAIEAGLHDELEAPSRPAPIRVGPGPGAIDLAGFGTVVWATGFRTCHDWLPAAALDDSGGLRHDGGVGEMPGLYVLGLPFLRRRKSTFIDGVGPDATELAAHLVAMLARRPVPTH
ncbi:NAD(P)-binding domain-containing protein [Salsipaludibacter albus]|uniref:NAD(P)-binding domain-containing protein n=1 Tax=Salsipaludibacter albus TaxID=2849650 RepID=UPI001EE4C3A3|nr:NAD(P)-binding domain-containing protein [Salsipaludibacter albus]MBY5164379.1 NAD(P)-binding domain-containing protein [Salsipaludibacter albus]